MAGILVAVGVGLSIWYHHRGLSGQVVIESPAKGRKGSLGQQGKVLTITH